MTATTPTSVQVAVRWARRTDSTGDQRPGSAGHPSVRFAPLGTDRSSADPGCHSPECRDGEQPQDGQKPMEAKWLLCDQLQRGAPGLNTMLWPVGGAAGANPDLFQCSITGRDSGNPLCFIGILDSYMTGTRRELVISTPAMRGMIPEVDSYNCSQTSRKSYLSARVDRISHSPHRSRPNSPMGRPVKVDWFRRRPGKIEGQTVLCPVAAAEMAIKQLAAAGGNSNGLMGRGQHESPRQAQAASDSHVGIWRARTSRVLTTATKKQCVHAVRGRPRPRS